ncbi:MAG: hypothetical protein AAF340_16380 [Pseudomonadota bacterium]
MSSKQVEQLRDRMLELMIEKVAVFTDMNAASLPPLYFGCLSIAVDEVRDELDGQQSEADATDIEAAAIMAQESAHAICRFDIEALMKTTRKRLDCAGIGGRGRHTALP